MPTILTCPSCGKRSQVANQPPGSAVRCPHCSSVMKVPGDAPRAAAAPAVVTEPTADPPRTPPLLGPLDAAPAVEGPAYICSVCGGSFPLEQVFDQEGSIICEGCHARTTSFAAGSEEAGPESFPAVPTLSTLTLPPADEEALPSDTSGIASEEATPQAPDVDAARDAGAVHATDADDDTIPDLSAVPASVSSTPRETVPKQFPMALVIGGGAVAFVLAVIVTYHITNHGAAGSDTPAGDSGRSAPLETSADDQVMSEWERHNAPRLSQWRSTAKSMEVSGDPAGAQMLYEKMLKLAKAPGATVENPGIVGMLAEAQASFDAISKKIGPPPPPMVLAPPAPGPPPAGNPSPAPPGPSTAPSAVPTESTATAPASTEPSAPAPTSAPVRVADGGANWEPAHRDQLLKLSADAAALEKQSQPVAALAKLQLLLQLVSDHRAALTDAQMKEAVISAGDSRKRLLVFARDSDEARAITARSLLAAGLKAEQEKKWKTARDSLSDASHLIAPMLKPVKRYRDPMYLASLNAEAVAYMNLKLNQRAGELFADDEPLGRASLAMNSPSRDLVWNRAVNDLAQKFNILRSVKMLHDYMDLHKDADEPLLNLLGTVLFVADESAPANRKVLDDAIGFYSQRSMDLEKTRPGQRRWGIQWLPDADAQAKFDEYNKSLDAYQAALRSKIAADTHVKDVQDSLRTPNGRATPADVTVARKAATAAAAGVKAAHDAIPRPPWLTDVEPVIPQFETAAPMMLAAAPTTTPALPGPSGAPPAVAPASQPSTEIEVPSAPRARYTAAFPIDRTHLLTAAEPLGNATTVKIEDTNGNVMTARVVAKSDRLALLEVSPADAGGPLKYLTLATDFTGGPVQCAAIPEANLFVPTVTLLNADASPPSRSAWWVNLSDHPRLPGSPLLNAQNEVIGVEVAAREDARQKIPAVTLDDLRKFLTSNHIVSVASGSKPDPNFVSQVAAESE